MSEFDSAPRAATTPLAAACMIPLLTPAPSPAMKRRSMTGTSRFFRSSSRSEYSLISTP